MFPQYSENCCYLLSNQQGWDFLKLGLVKYCALSTYSGQENANLHPTSPNPASQIPRLHVSDGLGTSEYVFGRSYSLTENQFSGNSDLYGIVPNCLISGRHVLHCIQKAVPKTKSFREEVHFFGKSVQICAQIRNYT